MCVLDWGGHWADHLSLVESSYNNSYHGSIGMAPVEVLYGRPCRTLLCWTQVGGEEHIWWRLCSGDHREDKVVKPNMKEAQDGQRSYAYKRRRELEFEVGDKVYIKMAMLRGPNRSISKTKLCPRYMGPFRIVERVGPVAYRLELPHVMRTFYKVFHVLMLSKSLHKDDEVLAKIPEDLQPNMTSKEDPGTSEEEDFFDQSPVGLPWCDKGDLGARGEDEGKVQEVVREAGCCLSLSILGFQFQSC